MLLDLFNDLLSLINLLLLFLGLFDNLDDSGHLGKGLGLSWLAWSGDSDDAWLDDLLVDDHWLLDDDNSLLGNLRDDLLGFLDLDLLLLVSDLLSKLGLLLVLLDLVLDFFDGLDGWNLSDDGLSAMSDELDNTWLDNLAVDNGWLGNPNGSRSWQWLWLGQLSGLLDELLGLVILLPNDLCDLCELWPGSNNFLDVLSGPPVSDSQDGWFDDLSDVVNFSLSSFDGNKSDYWSFDELDVWSDEGLDLSNGLRSLDLLFSGNSNESVDLLLIGVLLDDGLSGDDVSEDSWFGHLWSPVDWLAEKLDGSSWNSLDLSDDGESSLSLGVSKSDLDVPLNLLEGLSSSHGSDLGLTSLISNRDNSWLSDEVDLCASEVSGGKGWSLNDLESLTFDGFLHDVKLGSLLLSNLLVDSLKLASVSNNLDNSLSISSGDRNSSRSDDLEESTSQYLNDWLLENLDLVGDGGGEIGSSC